MPGFGDVPLRKANPTSLRGHGAPRARSVLKAKAKRLNVNRILGIRRCRTIPQSGLQGRSDLARHPSLPTTPHPAGAKARRGAILLRRDTDRPFNVVPGTLADCRCSSERRAEWHTVSRSTLLSLA